LGDQRLALLDPVFGDQDVQVIPERLGELRLIVEQIHDPQIGSEVLGRFDESRMRNMPALGGRPKARKAVLEIRGIGPDGLSRHVRMTGPAGFTAPGRRRGARGDGSRRLGGSRHSAERNKNSGCRYGVSHITPSS
jgi:hypothetical protein